MLLQILDLARHLFRLFALSLGLEETYFDKMTTHPGGIARLLYYPPPKSSPPQSPALSSEEQVGLGAARDYHRSNVASLVQHARAGIPIDPTFAAGKRGTMLAPMT